MSDSLPPPIRPSLGSTFKRPLNELTVGDEATGFVSISDTLPASLDSYYMGEGLNTVADAFIELSPGDASNPVPAFWYELIGQAYAADYSQYAQGLVTSDDRVHEVMQARMNVNSMVPQLLVKLLQDDNTLSPHDRILIIEATQSTFIESVEIQGNLDMPTGTVSVGNSTVSPTFAFIDSSGEVSGNWHVDGSIDVDGAATLIGGGDDGNGHALGFIDVTTVSITFATAVSNISTQTFAHAFTTPPRAVIPVIQGALGAANGWTARTDSYTNTNCRLVLSGPSAAWTNNPVLLIAIK